MPSMLWSAELLESIVLINSHEASRQRHYFSAKACFSTVPCFSTALRDPATKKELRQPQVLRQRYVFDSEQEHML